VAAKREPGRVLWCCACWRISVGGRSQRHAAHWKKISVLSKLHAGSAVFRLQPDNHPPQW